MYYIVDLSTGKRLRFDYEFIDGALRDVGNFFSDDVVYGILDSDNSECVAITYGGREWRPAASLTTYTDRATRPPRR